MGLAGVPKWAPWAVGGVALLLVANKVSGGSLFKSAGSGAVDIAADIASGVVDGAVAAVSPTNEQNVFNTSAESIYQGVTGSSGSIGTDYYDSTHNADGSLAWWAYIPGNGYAVPALAADSWEKFKSFFK